MKIVPVVVWLNAETKTGESGRIQIQRQNENMVQAKGGITMLELKDIFGHTLQKELNMEAAIEAAARLPQVVDIHDNITGDTCSRSPGWRDSWVWHWENW